MELGIDNVVRKRSSVTDVNPEIKQLASVFKEYRNTITIYTEDNQKDKEFYANLLKRLLENTAIEIKDIYPLGCRKTVIKQCREDKTKGKKLYIVDGDVLMQYSSNLDIPNLFVLDSYCIENYVICEDSVCYVAYIYGGIFNMEEIRSKLNYNLHLNDIFEPLIELFFHFSIQEELLRNFELQNIQVYMDKKNCKLDKNRIYEKIDDIKSNIIEKTSNEVYNEKILERRTKYPYNIETLLQIVSGKDYLIPYFKLCIDRCLGCSIKVRKESWKMNMANKCDLSKLSKLKDTIINVCS